MTITLPDEMRENLEVQARAGGFASIEDYLKELVDDDASADWAESDRHRLLALAEEGLKTPPIENPESFLSELIRRTEAGEPIADLVPLADGVVVVRVVDGRRNLKAVLSDSD